MKSHRPDGRGHWPAGKHRHPDAGEWDSTRESLIRLIEDHWRPDHVSIRSMAGAVGVHVAAARKWIAGTTRPSPERQEAVQRWVEDRWAEIRGRANGSEK